MAEDGSHSRFSALISGTAVENLSPVASLLRRTPGVADTPQRSASPAFFARRAHVERTVQDASQAPTHEKPSRFDPVRRFRGSESQGHASVTPMRSYRDRSSTEQRVSSPASVDSSRSPVEPRTVYGPLKSRKSLKQRFDYSEEHSLSSDPSDLPGGAEPAPFTGHDRGTRPTSETYVAQAVSALDDVQSVPHSRSGSVASSIFHRPPQSQSIPDDDISAIMMRGATDLRNTKAEVEQQRREIAFLQSQLESVMKEKDETLQRLKTVKESAKEGLNSSLTSLENMKASFESLRVQSETTFAFFAEAKAALPSVKEMRTVVDDTLQRIEPLLNDEGHLYKADETRATLHELKLESEQAQRVVDLLRESLQNVGSELVEAKNRVADLESVQSTNNIALRQSAKDVAQAFEKVENFAMAMKDEQKRLSEQLAANATLEERCSSASAEISRLQHTISDREAELSKLSGVVTENAKLNALLEERAARLSELVGMEAELKDLNAGYLERLAQIGALDATITSKDQTITEYRTRIATAEARLCESHGELDGMKRALGACEVREQEALNDLSRAKANLLEAQATIVGLKTSIEEMKQEIDRRVEQVHQSNTQCKILEERFEAQSITLRVATQENGDKQERLIESEARFARELEAATGKLEREIAVLSEQNKTFQGRAQELEEAARLREQHIVDINGERQAELQKLESTHLNQVAVVEANSLEAHKALEDARATSRSLETELASARGILDALRDELRQAKPPSCTHQEVIDVLNAQTMALRTENANLMLRTRNIDARYRAGDLNEEEKLFINTLIQTSQNIHEQELVAKGNELRRRDNVIKDLQARVKLLEKTLARKHVDEQTKGVVAGPLANSLIDPTAWAASSEQSSSPPMAPDADLPTTNMDTVSAKPTPAAARMPARPPLASVPTPAPNIMVRTPGPTRLPRDVMASAKGTPVPAYQKTPISSKVRNGQLTSYAPNKSSPLVPPRTPVIASQQAPAVAEAHQPRTKTIFSRLASDLSDDIAEFDERRQHRRSPILSASPPEQPLAKTTKLGKRSKPADPSSPLASQPAPRLAKRMRTRSRADAQIDPHEGSSRVSPKVISRCRVSLTGTLKHRQQQPVLQKTRTRKRR